MIRYYAAANGFSGHVNFVKEIIGENTVFVSNSVKAERMEILNRMGTKCHDIIMRAGTTDDIDAIVTEKGAVIFSFADYDFLRSVDLSEKLYGFLSKAKSVHDEWEKIYISNMDFKKAEKAAFLAAEKLIGQEKGNGSSLNVNRFFGTLTDGDPVNFINNITDGFSKRIFIKGRPGTGKSTLMKYVRSRALASGFDTETYLCSFDPGSLDMVVIRERGVCIFDSTAPHEMFPSREGDEILDVYEIAVNPETDIKYKNELDEFSKSYSEYIKNAKKCIKDINGQMYAFEDSRKCVNDNRMIDKILKKLE